jgi:hypothetical protein
MVLLVAFSLMNKNGMACCACCDIHGWNRENGLPTHKTLHRLGLESAVEDLSKPVQAAGWPCV